MPAIPHVHRRGAMYYWRRRMPARFSLSKKSTTLLLGLRTADSVRARFLSHQITALTELHFFPAIMTLQLSPQQIQSIFRDVFTRHLDKLDGVVARERMEVDFDWQDSRRNDRLMGWAYRLLETRGQNATIDPAARAAIAADQMDEQDIADVAAILAIMQRQNLAAEPPERLVNTVKGVGAQPSAVNLALAQETIYRAMADANFQTDRRYSGVRSENPTLVAEILKARVVAVPQDSSATAHPLHEPTALPTAHLSSEPRDGPRLDISSPSGPASVESVVGNGLDSRAAAAALDETAPAHAEISGKPVLIRPEEHPFRVCGEELIARRSKDGNWDHKTQKQARQIFRLFTKLLIEKSVFELTDLRQRHFGQLDSLFATISNSYGRSPKDEERTIEELRLIGAGKPPEQRGIAPETRNRHWTFLGQLITSIKASGIALDRDINLTLLRAKTGAKRGRQKRSVFRPDDLAAIFNLACFTGCEGWEDKKTFKPGSLLFHRGLYFAIILLYYTGARREEICGLMLDDIKSEEFNIEGEKRIVPCVCIHRNSERRIKNVQSIRLIPLLPEVVRLGFLEYVSAIRALGYTLVFPDLKSPTSQSPMGDRLYDEFTRGLKIAVPDAQARKKVLHSFRKTFGDRLKQAGISAEIRGDILGHGGETVTEEIYCDHIEVTTMLQTMSHLPIVTGHLEARPITLLPWVEAKEPAPFSRSSRAKASKSDVPSIRRTRHKPRLNLPKKIRKTTRRPKDAGAQPRHN